MRIVSLVPSLTATVVDLGLEASLVGCTSFCVDPPGLARRITVVGGTKDPNLNKIRSLAPDRILVNTEENRAEDIALCRKIAPVHESFPKSPKDVPDMIRAIGIFLGEDDAGALLATDTAKAIDDLAKAGEKNISPDSFVYLIWQNPWMVAGNDTYISQLLECAGLRNSVLTARYPNVPMDTFVKLAPEIIFFSSEPWPFRKRDCEAFSAEWQARTSQTMPRLFKIDGKSMSWHGSETKRAATSLRLWIEGDRSTGIIQPALQDGS